jgi:hypothetical protein
MPYYKGRVPDRFGDWGLDGTCNQQVHRPERVKPGVMDVDVGKPRAPRAPVPSRRKEVFEPVFKPPKARGLTTFHRFPAHEPDPLDAKIAAARERAATQRMLLSSISSKPFKPTPCDLDYRLFKETTPAFRPMATRSIVFHASNFHR